MKEKHPAREQEKEKKKGSKSKQKITSQSVKLTMVGSPKKKRKKGSKSKQAITLQSVKNPQWWGALRGENTKLRT
jgi:hypothetical protein